MTNLYLTVVIEIRVYYIVSTYHNDRLSTAADIDGAAPAFNPTQRTETVATANKASMVSVGDVEFPFCNRCVYKFSHCDWHVPIHDARNFRGGNCVVQSPSNLHPQRSFPNRIVGARQFHAIP